MRHSIKIMISFFGIIMACYFIFPSFKDTKIPPYSVVILDETFYPEKELSLESLDTLYLKAYALTKYERSTVLDLSYNDLNSIYQYLDTNFITSTIEGSPYVISFYCLKDNSDNLVSFENLKGLSLWMYNGTNLNHYYFRNDKGDLIEERSLSTTSDYFSFLLNDALHFYSFKEGENPDETISYIYRGNLNSGARIYTGIHDGGIIESILKAEDFSYAHRVVGMTDSTIKIYWDSKLYGNLKYPITQCEKYDCGNGDGECRDMTPEDENIDLDCYTKADHTCRFTQLADTAKKINLFSLADFKFDSLYMLRDNFLTGFEKGRDYIRYYYLIGYISKNTPITTSQVTTYLSTFPSLYALNNKLLSSNNCDDTLITTSMKNSLISFITTYKGYSSDVIYQDFLDQIESDLIYFTNKTKTEIFRELNISSPCTESVRKDDIIISENTSLTGFSIFPNPNKGVAIIECKDIEIIGSKSKIEIFDISGKLLYYKDIVIQQKMVIDIGKLKSSSSVMMVRITTNTNAIYNMKLLMSR